MYIFRICNTTYSQSVEFPFFYFQASGTKLMDEKYHWFVLTKVKKKNEKLITTFMIITLLLYEPMQSKVWEMTSAFVAMQDMSRTWAGHEEMFSI